MLSENSIHQYYDRQRDKALDYYRAFLNKDNTPPQYSRMNYAYLLNLKVKSAQGRLTERLLRKMKAVIWSGVMHLDICSSLAGHTRYGYLDVWEGVVDDNFNDQDDAFVDWILDIAWTPGKEAIAVSDYGTRPTLELFAKSIEADTVEERYMYYDQIIHVSHYNGDLAYLYVNGGSHTLNKLPSNN